MTKNQHYGLYPYGPGPHVANSQGRWAIAQPDLNLLLNAAKNGAMVGAAGAGAMQLQQLQQQKITWQQAVSGTVSGALKAGVATAAATVVGHLISKNSALSLAATLATGTAVMYALNKPEKAGK